MHGAALFNTVAHGTTVFYYAHVLRHVAEIKLAAGVDPAHADPAQRVFLEFRPKFITIWGVVLQALLFVLCFVHDASRVLSPSNPVRRGVRSARDLVLVALSGPAAITVTLLFWALFWLDRELVMPASVDELVPAWLNHSMHSFVFVLVLVQLLAEPHRPPPLGASLAVGCTLSVAYLYTLFAEFAATGRWIYPVFGVLAWPGRVALAAAAVVLYLAQVVFMRAMVKARWGSPHAHTKASKKHKD